MSGKVLTPYPPPVPVTLQEALLLASQLMQYINNNEPIPVWFPREKLPWAIHLLWSVSLTLQFAESQTEEGEE